MCISPAQQARKQRPPTLLAALTKTWRSVDGSSSAVGLPIDGSFQKMPSPTGWAKLATCWLGGAQPDDERAEPRLRDDFLRLDFDEEAPPADAGPLHYAGLDRPWSDARERAFRARLEAARASGAVLVLLRHGESEWNATDTFTGWADVGVTAKGRRQAADAGSRLARSGVDAFDDLHSSALRRTVDTLALTLEALNGRALPTGPRGTVARAEMPRQATEPMTHCRSWQLNERHYGALTGVEKSAARERYGADRIKTWRRGWRDTPPPMGPGHSAYPPIEEAYKLAGGFPGELPAAESLATCEARVTAHFENVVRPQLLRGRRVLVAAHNNVIRCLIHHLDRRPQVDGGEDAELIEELSHIDIPYATPLVYTFYRGGDVLTPFADSTQRGIIKGTFLT